MSPARRRACVAHVVACLGVPERTACRVLGQHRSTQRKLPRTADDEAALTADIVELARRYGRYGYRRITALLQAAGWLAGQPQAGRADLAAGGAQGTGQAAEAGSALVGGRLVRAAAGIVKLAAGRLAEAGRDG